MQLSEDEQADSSTDVRRDAGWFRFYFDDDRWEWSPEVAAMHGYRPGTVTPNTALVLSHKHPDDRQHVEAMLHEIRHNHQAFSTSHRIVDTAGGVRHVIVVADKLTDDNGAVVGTHGFYLDVTPAQNKDEARLNAAIAKIAENRAVIEQAKGMLMVVYGITAEAAFDLLRWRSQEANVKLRLLAAQVVDDFLGVAQSGHRAARAVYDNLLLTADRRLAGQS